MNNRVLCQSCNQQRLKLHPAESKIFKGHKLILCQICIDAGFEPRSLVIIGARQLGHDAVKEFIKNKLYVGEDIPAVDIIYP